MRGPSTALSKNVTLQKGLLVLETLAAQAREFTVSELAEHIGLGRSQTCELLATLVASDYVVRNPQNRRYRIGLRPLELSSDILARMELRRAGLSYIYDLMRQTGGQTLLGVQHRGAVLLLDTLYPEGRYDAGHPGFGGRLGLTSTALGKTLLAHLPEAERQRLCSPATLALLAEELAEIRRVGLGCQTAYDGLAPVSQGWGAVVRGPEGDTAAVLGVRVSWKKWELCDQERFLSQVLGAARGLSLALGWVPGR
jgi:IclR family transcriptional regulator, KDG regulon repressor